MNQVTRRHFIKGSTLLVGAYATHRSFGADLNGEVRVAVVGLRGRGGQLIKDTVRSKGARLVALCDVDTAVLEEAVAEVKAEYDLEVAQETDYRKLLERSDIDAVAIATPNHWHALQTIWACQAGKDVYVEKPVCHTLWEGRRMIEAARKYGRIVQSGFQNRSDVGLKEAFAWIHAGNLGAIKQVRGLCYRNRASIGKRDTPLVPPDTVNYNRWLGPAADLPMYREQFHYDWHWIWNTGNGDMGNQGPHEMDLIRWVLGEPDHPQGVFSMGGRFAWDDAGNTPNMQIAALDWPSQRAIFEVRNLWVNPETNSAPNFKGNRVGVVVTCEGGEFRGGRGGGIVYNEDNRPQERFKGDGGYDHFPSFIRAINSRKESDLASPLEQGYKSSALSLLANHSYHVGKARNEKQAARFVADKPLLSEAYERFDEQLKTWQVDLDRDRWTVGSSLQFDAAAEQFTGGKNYRKANALLRRDDRPDYAVPEKV